MSSSFIFLDGIELSSGLIWTDEFDWTPIKQKVSRALDGTMMIQEGVMQAGRPITLKGERDLGWVTRLQLEQLQTRLAKAENMQLTLADDRVFTVRWRQSDKPIDAAPIRRIAVPRPTDVYVVSLKLLTV
ncbi:MAG: hypothetical protein NT086_08915 [Proteobacteria bacterium]|nr:hypothetical protein [Pseudomonadota bacterium]